MARSSASRAWNELLFCYSRRTEGWSGREDLRPPGPEPKDLGAFASTKSSTFFAERDSRDSVQYHACSPTAAHDLMASIREAVGVELLVNDAPLVVSSATGHLLQPFRIPSTLHRDL